MRLHAARPEVLIGLAFFAAGAMLAASHPTSPGWALGGFAAWCLIAWYRPGAWLFVLPACLPAAAFGPWTGWVAFDEFDLVVLGALAAGHARPRRVDRDGAAAAAPIDPVLALAMLCASLSLISIGRAVLAADGLPFGWFDSELDPMNVLRVGKSELYALLLLPLLREGCRRAPTEVFRRVSAGMLVGSGIVCLAVLWERAAYPGLFDLSKPYRTVALFWEMHVGGAAIDAYLAMAAPFVAHAVVRARTPLRFAACSLLAVVTEYACLTTYSRGLYFALAGSLAVYAALAARRPIVHAVRVEVGWRRPAGAALVAILIAELVLVLVLGSDSFMLGRLERVSHDLRSRIEHWQRGLALLHGAPDWWLGKGMGRLPAELAGAGLVEPSGSARVVADSGQPHLELRGPSRSDALVGRYALAQRVPREAVAYQLSVDVRSERPSRLLVAVCDIHLLYEKACRRASTSIAASGPAWEHLTLKLEGAPGPPGTGSELRRAVLSLAIGQAGSVVELDNLVLSDGGSSNVLRNADFSRDLAHWYPMAKDYFVPWHIDNLALEILIEQGIAGLLAFALLMACAFAALFGRRRRANPIVAATAPVLAAALAGALLVGVVSSVLDMPRVAFLMFFLALLPIELERATPDSSSEETTGGRRKRKSVT